MAAVEQRLGEAASHLQGTAPNRSLEHLEILLLDSPAVNAQAFPGGLIVLHRGLLERLDNAEELAAVVAHEMAHVYYRDSLAALRRQLGLSLLLAVVGLPQGGEALERLIEQATHLHYSRKVEARADRYALELLAAARLDPGRLADALQRIAGAGSEPHAAAEQQERLPELLQYLQTHPALQDRVKAARARSAELQVNEQPVAAPEGWPASLKDPTPDDPPDT